MRQLRIALFLGLISALSAAIALPYTLPLGIKSVESVGAQVSPVTLVVSTIITMTVYGFLSSWLGLALISKTGLRADWISAVVTRAPRPAWNKRGVITALLWGVAAMLILAALMQWLFIPNIPQLGQTAQAENTLAWWVGITTIFQGGIVEELMLRLGVMTLLVWVMAKLLARGKQTLPSWIYVVAIVLAAFLFAVGHFGAAMGIFGTLSGWVLAYVLVGNMLAGLGFGWLYWRYGLEYAMISHITADFMLHFVLANVMS
jgi:hypothetical protein